MSDVKPSDMDNVLETKNSDVRSDIDCWLVHIPANVYMGKYYEIDKMLIIVPKEIIPNKEDVIPWCLNHKNEIIEDAKTKRRFGHGLVRTPAEENIFFDDKTLHKISVKEGIIPNFNMTKFKQKYKLD